MFSLNSLRINEGILRHGVDLVEVVWAQPEHDNDGVSLAAPVEGLEVAGRDEATELARGLLVVILGAGTELEKNEDKCAQRVLLSRWPQ